ncbi:MAG: ATP-dependent zinc metalloprotease FtsH [Planctomycetaceae bacterium]|jgi:cell division protease FtsH|nr:ATP-dependent zinc metalloprotease FtsH [Planctomycetaceae bacterium]
MSNPDSSNKKTPSPFGSSQNNESPGLRRSGTPTFFLILLLATIGVFLYYSSTPTEKTRITWGDFKKQLDNDNILKFNVQGMAGTGEFRKIPEVEEITSVGEKKLTKVEKSFSVDIPEFAFHDGSAEKQLQEKLGGHYSAKPIQDNSVWIMFIYLGVMVGIVIFVWMMMRRAQERMMGGVNPGFHRSPAKRYHDSGKRTTFEDVAGLGGVKKELEEIVDYLKNPEKFIRMGAQVPKGTLLIGSPGTGKTLLARAIAGEANVPFFSINGSEFIQLYVGVGASRVRDMFATAKENSPAILFIDEIDAVGRQRGSGLGGGHDEREQTLNQILSEMDGFQQNEMVMVLAATNRPDILDPALLRPGRFDRHITVDRPSLKGRIEMFKVHSKNVPVAEDVDFEKLAKSTVGYTGADIRNMINEATLWATRHDKTQVDNSDFEYAHVKVVMGLKREENLTPEEKRRTAYHEAGHTIIGWFEPVNSRVHKVSIIPRGRALGATMVMPDEDQLSIAETQLHAEIAFLMGGRVAEKLIYDEYSAGAENDLKRATQMAKRMVIHWGMSEKLGPVAFRNGESHPFLGREIAENREYSEQTAQLIDTEMFRILRESETQARRLIQEKRDLFEVLAKRLEQEEELEEVQLEEILGPSPYKKPQWEEQ